MMISLLFVIKQDQQADTVSNYSSAEPKHQYFAAKFIELNR